jgi:predicted ATPase
LHTLETASTTSNSKSEKSADETLLEQLTSLVASGLLVRSADPDGTPRFRMLDTIREFALDQLIALDEAAQSNRAFACSMLALARRVDLRGPLQGSWGQRLDAEWPNLRAALAWAVEHNEVAAGSEILWAIMANWLTTNLQAVEAAEWSDRLIALSVSHPPEVRAMALLAGGELSLTLAV